MYGFVLHGMGKTEGVFEVSQVREKVVSIIICLDWSLVFVDFQNISINWINQMNK